MPELSQIDAKMVQKRSTVASEVPTVAPSEDHTDGSWNDTDIYSAEIFVNETDEKVFIRTGATIKELGVGGGGVATLRNISSTDTFATANETINCTSGTFIVNLPTAVGIQGTTYTLVNSGTGIITLKGNIGQTINGSTTIDLAQYISRTVQSDNANWIII